MTSLTLVAPQSNTKTSFPVSSLSNIEAEQNIIGAILINNDALSYASGLRTEHFSQPLHQAIYETIKALMGSGVTANPVTMQGRVATPENYDINIGQYLMDAPAQSR